MSNVKRKKSAVRCHFNETNSPTKLECSYCKRIISISCGSTGNLMRHLRMRHPNVNINKERNNSVSSNNVVHIDFSPEIVDSHTEAAQAVLGLGCDPADNIEKPNQELVLSQTQHMQYYLLEPVDESKSKELNKQFLKMIVKDFHPFRMIENSEFRKLINTLNPAYTLPSQKDLKNTLLPEIYETAVSELKSTLMEVTAVALTTEKWTSIDNERYISVTAHYLNKDFQLESSFLSCVSFPEKHSSSNIAAFLQSVTTEWELSDKVVAVVTDSVPCMNSAIRECKWLHVPCFASVLDKTVNAGLIEIKSLLQKIRQIVGYFKRNAAAQQILSEIQNENDLPNLKMKSDVQTRWNSTFEMIARFFKNKEPLIKAVKRLPNISQLSHSDWIIIEKAIRLLIIFNSVTVEISSENTLYLSKVPYMVKFMIKHISNILDQNDVPLEIANMGALFKEELQNYFEELESNNIIGQSVLLDPRFKKRGFPENSFDEAYSSLRNQIISLKTEKVNTRSALNQSQMHNDITQSEYFIDIWCEFKEKEPEPRNNADEAAIAEIGTFMNDEFLSLSDSPVVYWGNKLNQNKFPTLFELVKRRLCIPAVAVPGQRIYTKQGNHLLEKRRCLISSKIKEILFVSHNL